MVVEGAKLEWPMVALSGWVCGAFGRRKKRPKAKAAPTIEKNAITEPIPIPALAPTLSSPEDCMLTGAEEAVGVTELEELVEVLEG